MGSCAANAERPGCTYVVGADGVDLLDLVAEGHGLVDEELDKVMRRRLAREELELAVDGARPGENDAEGDLRRGNLVSTEVAYGHNRCRIDVVYKEG